MLNLLNGTEKLGIKLMFSNVPSSLKPFVFKHMFEKYMWDFLYFLFNAIKYKGMI